MNEPVTFGLALDSAALAAALPATLPEAFGALRISADAADSPKLRALKETIALSCSGLADRTLCRLAPESAIRLKADFLEQFKKRALAVHEAGAESIRCDFDLDAALRDAVYGEALRRLLLGILGVLEPLPLKLVFPIRLPLGGGVENLGAYDRFFRALPGRNLGVEAEFHPHEASFAALAPDILRPVRFALDSLSFVFEPATGNRLTAAPLRERIRAAAGFGRELTVFFHPANIEPDALHIEIAELAQLAAELRREEKSC